MGILKFLRLNFKNFKGVNNKIKAISQGTDTPTNQTPKKQQQQLSGHTLQVSLRENNNNSNNSNNNNNSNNDNSNDNKRMRECWDHRRSAESYNRGEDSEMRTGLSVACSIPPPPPPLPLLSSTSLIQQQSPRQRSRIRTNPWLSAVINSSTATTSSTAPRDEHELENYRSFKSNHRLTYDEITSTCSSGLKVVESLGSASDINIANTRRQAFSRRDEFRQESLSAGQSP